MWLFTRYGFYSTSVARKGSGVVTVRARLKAHLEGLIKRFTHLLQGALIVSAPERDYFWRMDVDRQVWSRIVEELALEQDWANFKGETGRYQAGKPGGLEYERALHQIWSVMHRLQMQEQRPLLPRTRRVSGGAKR